MNILSLLGQINYLAVLVATLASFVLGFIWYSPWSFGTAWMKSIDMTEQDMKTGHTSSIMLVSFVTIFIAGMVMSMLFGGAGMMMGVKMGLILGIGLVAMQRTMHAMYEMKNMSYILITTGFDIVLFVIMGGIIGSW